MLEAICFFSFIATWIVAENIPLCALFMAVFFMTGFVLERQAEKVGYSEKEN